MIATINKIIPFSNVDGDGNRIAIFFQSCPFDCWYCHNPETINVCNNCGHCVPTCPSAALTIKDGHVVWDEVRCTQCDTCTSVCPSNSSPKTLQVTPEELLCRIEKYFPFVRGITFSGGECMEHAGFIEAFAELIKDKKKSIYLDSNGHYLFREYPRLLELIDGIMLDVKAVDPVFHQKLTKQSNENVLLNLQYLLEHKKLIEVRTVFLPNQPLENERTIREVLVLIQNECTYKWIAYRPYGVRKNKVELCGTTSFSTSFLQEEKQKWERKGFHNIKIV